MVNVNNSYVATPPIDGGVLFSAPLGSVLPVDAIEALDVAFVDHGAVGENGVQIQRTRNIQQIRMFGGKVFRTVQTEMDGRVIIELLEDDNEQVLKTIYGDANVTVEAATVDGVAKKIYHTAEQLPIQSWVIDTIDGEKTKRYVIEKGQVVETSEINDVHSNVTRHQITIETYESENGAKGENVLELRNDAAQAVSS